MNTHQKEIESARTLLTAGAVVAIIAGIIWCFTGIGILWAWTDIIGGIILLRLKGKPLETIQSKKTSTMIWGIVFLVTSFLGGALVLFANYKFNQITATTPQVRRENDFMSLEKAYELKEKGVLTDEEFENIKVKTLG